MYLYITRSRVLNEDPKHSCMDNNFHIYTIVYSWATWQSWEVVEISKYSYVSNSGFIVLECNMLSSLTVASQGNIVLAYEAVHFQWILCANLKSYLKNFYCIFCVCLSLTILFQNVKFPVYYLYSKVAQSVEPLPF